MDSMYLSPNEADAKTKILAVIPEGFEVVTMASVTLYTLLSKTLRRVSKGSTITSLYGK